MPCHQNYKVITNGRNGFKSFEIILRRKLRLFNHNLVKTTTTGLYNRWCTNTYMHVSVMTKEYARNQQNIFTY